MIYSYSLLANTEVVIYFLTNLSFSLFILYDSPIIIVALENI
jgi:hypothetical protein